MNEQERELDLMVGELEQENRLLRARNERLEGENEQLKAAMKLALEALKMAWNDEECSTSTHIAVKRGIKALEETLANHIRDDTKMVSGVKDSLTTQQEQGEPVAWLDEEKKIEIKEH